MILDMFSEEDIKVVVSYLPVWEFFFSMHVLSNPEHHVSRQKWVQSKEKCLPELVKEIRNLKTLTNEWILIIDSEKWSEIRQMEIIEMIRYFRKKNIYQWNHWVKETTGNEMTRKERDRILNVMEAYYETVFRKEEMILRPYLIRVIQNEKRKCQAEGLWNWIGKIHTRLQVEETEIIYLKNHEFKYKKKELNTVFLTVSTFVYPHLWLFKHRQELEVVNKNVASQEEVLKITEVRYNTGLVAKLDVAQAKSVLYSTKASIPQLEAGINQYITTLAVLLGMYPQEIRPVLETTGTLPDYMEPIGVGMPVDLLLRRPDVRSAERSVNAQAALLGASKSDWLPKIFLKGSFGYAARDLNDLVKSKSMTYEIAPSLSWTIFSGGQLVNATRLAKAQLDESINQFNQTVLTAVQETDNAMNSYRNSIKQIVALREVRNQGVETLKLSLELYKQGLSPFQNVLDAQRSLLSYENQLVQAQGSSLLQLISLYKALGGGWRE